MRILIWKTDNVSAALWALMVIKYWHLLKIIHDITGMFHISNVSVKRYLKSVDYVCMETVDHIFLLAGIVSTRQRNWCNLVGMSWILTWPSILWFLLIQIFTKLFQWEEFSLYYISFLTIEKTTWNNSSHRKMPNSEGMGALSWLS